MNEQHAKQNGPILLYLGGEWEIEPSVLARSFVKDIANELQAAMFYLEHRYYGKTHPTRSVDAHKQYGYLNWFWSLFTI